MWFSGAKKVSLSCHKSRYREAVGLYWLKKSGQLSIWPVLTETNNSDFGKRDQGHDLGWTIIQSEWS